MMGHCGKYACECRCVCRRHNAISFFENVTMLLKAYGQADEQVDKCHIVPGGRKQFKLKRFAAIKISNIFSYINETTIYLMGCRLLCIDAKIEHKFNSVGVSCAWALNLKLKWSGIKFTDTIWMKIESVRTLQCCRTW